MGDLSELCTLEGPVCLSLELRQDYDPLYVLHISTEALREEREGGAGWVLPSDMREQAMDGTYRPVGPGRAPPAAYADAIAWAQGEGTTHRTGSTSTAERAWGADNRFLATRGVPWQALAAASRPEDIARVLGPAAARVAASAGARWTPADAASAQDVWVTESGVEAAREATALPARVTWLTGAAYFVSANTLGDGMAHPWHLSMGVLQLWGAKRANASRWEVPGALAARGGPALRLAGGRVALPPMSDALLLGGYGVEAVGWRGAPPPEPEGLPQPWLAGMWPLLGQASTRLWLGGDVAGATGREAAHWLCWPRAVSPGIKPRLFAGSGDAFAFRAAAYALAGVPLASPPAPALPPRRILLLQRGMRGFTRLPAVRALLQASGLPVQLVTGLDGMAWAEQVRLFAGAGIVVATPGGALSNLLHLPAGAVVLEVRPALNHWPLFAEVASLLGLHWRPLWTDLPPAGRPPPPPSNGSATALWEEVMTREWRAACDAPGARVSASQAGLHELCSQVITTAPYLPLARLRIALEEALDLIGCRRSECVDLAPGSEATLATTTVMRPGGPFPADAPSQGVCSEGGEEEIV